MLANLPGLESWKWLEKYSIFRYYDPVEAALKGQDLAFNAILLGAIGLAGIVLGFIACRVRALPTSG